MTLAEEFEAAGKGLRLDGEEAMRRSNRDSTRTLVETTASECFRLASLFDRAAELARAQEGVVQQIVGRKK